MHPGEQPRPSVAATVCETDGLRIRALFTSRAEGDFTPLELAVRPDPAGPDTNPSDLGRRQASLAPGEWSYLHQVHGPTVHVVDGHPIRGDDGDALVTRLERTPLSVRTADCAPILLWSACGGAGDGTDRDPPVLGAVHAGWKGLASGVVGECVATMRDLGADRIDWLLGPCISAAEYEFGPDDLTTMEDMFGPRVRAVTRLGSPALDLRAAVLSACAEAGLSAPHRSVNSEWPPCTASDDTYFSHRARGDTGRQVGVIWWERHV